MKPEVLDPPPPRQHAFAVQRPRSASSDLHDLLGAHGATPALGTMAARCLSQCRLHFTTPIALATTVPRARGSDPEVCLHPVPWYKLSPKECMPPSEVALAIYQREMGMSLQHFPEAKLPAAAKEINDYRVTADVLRAHFVKLRYIRLRRLEGARKASQTRQKNKDARAQAVAPGQGEPPRNAKAAAWAAAMARAPSAAPAPAPGGAAAPAGEAQEVHRRPPSKRPKPAAWRVADSSEDDDGGSEANDEAVSGPQLNPKLHLTLTMILWRLWFFCSQMHERTPEERSNIGKTVRIPQSAFPNYNAPECGYWIGQIVRSKKGGCGDEAIKIDGEEIFTRPKSEVAAWLSCS